MSPQRPMSPKRLPENPRPIRLACFAAALGLAFGVAGTAIEGRAQRQVVLGGNVLIRGSQGGAEGAARLVLPESADLNRVLRKVTEFFAQDPPKWDDGARMMQDLLEGKVFDGSLADEQMLNPFYSVYSADRRLYVPFARYCQDLICELPPEGLAAYRFLTDTTAEAAFEEARAAMDSATLDRIAQLYYASAPGPEIVSLLADLAELEGQLTRAIFLRDRLLETYPDLSDEKRVELLVRQLHTTALLGMIDRHAQLAEILEGFGPDRRVRVAGEDVPLRNLEAHPAFKLRDRSRASSGAGRSLASPSGFDSKRLQSLWRRDFDSADPYFLRTPSNNNQNYFFQGGARVLPHQKQHRPGSGVFTWIDANGTQQIAYKDHDALQVVEALSGKIRGEDGGRSRVQKPQNQQLRVRIPLTDIELQSVTSDGRYLYCTTGNKLPSRTSSRGGDNFPYRNSLRAFDLETGKPVWTSTRSSEVSKRVFFRGPPVRYREWLFAPVRQNAAFAIARLDAATGEIDKVVTVHEGGTSFLRVPGMPPLVVDNRLLYMTNAGAIASLSLPDLELRWLRAYEEQSPEEPPRKRRRAQTTRRYYRVQPKKIGAWRPRPLIVRDGAVLVAGCDSDALVALDINSGEALWFLPRTTKRRVQDFDEVIGVDSEGRVFLAGKNTLQAVDFASGKRLFEVDLTTLPKGPINGWSTIAGAYIWSPFDGGAYRFRREDGALEGVLEYPAVELGMPDWSQLPQRIQFAGSILLSICESGIRAYGSPDSVFAGSESVFQRARAYAAMEQVEEAFEALMGGLDPAKGASAPERARMHDFAVRLAGELSLKLHAAENAEKAEGKGAGVALLERCERVARAAGLPVDPRLILFRIRCLDPVRHAAEIRNLRNRIAALSERELAELAIDESTGDQK